MKMLIFFCALAVMSAASDAPPVLAASGQWKEAKYELWLDGVESGSWDPEKGEPPLSISMAVVLARKSLTDMVGEEATSMFCMEISVAPRSGRYLITFATIPTTAAFKGKDSFSPTVMPFAVFADGTVRSPKKSRSSH